MLQRFFIKKNSNFVKEFLSTLVLPGDASACAGITDVREIIEIKGNMNERTLSAVEKLSFFPYSESVSRGEGAEYKRLIVMNHPSRSDRRAREIVSTVKALEHKAKCEVRIGKEYVFASYVTKAEIDDFADKIVNPLMQSVGFEEDAEHNPAVSKHEIIEGFNSAQYTEFTEMKEKYRIKMDIDDLMCAQNYFLSESREPTLAELRIIDSFFSESFRHTTFETYLDRVDVKDPIVREAWNKYKELRNGAKTSLSDIARAAADTEQDSSVVKVSKKLSGVKLYGDKETSGPVLVVKNESHNRSTTLAPYDGAAGSISNSICDLLCALGEPVETYRVSGTGYSEQNKYNSRLSAEGYASYAEAVGVPCSKCTELRSNSYSDKQLEICAALAISDSENAEKLISCEAEAGDMIFLLGGKTGADGSLKSKINEGGKVKKYGEYIPVGQPGVLSSLVRLFARKEFGDILVSVNDVSSGGIICAIAEMADGVVIKTDAVELKQELMSAEEIILSESLERMLVCVKKENAEELIALCEEENVECASIASVNDSERITVYDENNQRIASLSSEFLISGGAEKHLSAIIEKAEELPVSEPLTVAKMPLQGVNSLKKIFRGIRPDFMGGFAKAAELSAKDVPLTEKYYDKTAGGNYFSLDTESEASIRLLKYNGGSIMSAEGKERCSVISCGVNPVISHDSPFKGAYLSVTEALLKLTTSGYGRERAYLSIQEYLPEHKNSSKRLGVSVAAMLGVFEAQMNLDARSLSGKISLGTGYKDNEEDSTITAFAVCIGEKGRAIPCNFEGEGGKVVLLQPDYDKNSGLPDAESQRDLIETVNELIAEGQVLSAATVNAKCAATVMIDMCRKNKLGVLVEPDTDAETLFENCYGSVLLEVKEDVEIKGAEVIGTVIGRPSICFRDEVLELDLAYENEVSETETSAEEYGLFDEKCGFYGEVKTADKVLNVLIAQSDFSANDNCVKDEFEKLGAMVEIFPIGELDHDAFAKAVTKTDILWIPDGPESYMFLSAALMNQSVQSAVTYLRRRRGLIYGCGSGFAALVASGIMGLDTEKLGFCKISELPVNEKVSLKVISSLSPFLSGCEPVESYQSYVPGSVLALKADEEYLRELAEKGQIALKTADGENKLGCTNGVEAIVSEDGLVFGQISQPVRLAAENADESVLDVIKAAVGYFKAEPKSEDSESSDEKVSE